ncbi:MAG: hypothetical protein ACSLFC_13015 [Desulfuromonadales bacterium]
MNSKLEKSQDGFFKKEAKFMVGTIIGLIVVVVLAAWLIPFLSHHIEVDRCLDSGGAYDYENNVCLFSDKKAGTK